MTITVAKPETPLPEVSWAEFLAQFDPAAHATIALKLDDPSAEGMFMAETAELRTYRYDIVGVVYGPGKTYDAGRVVVGGLVADRAGTTDLKVMRNRVTRAAYLAAVEAGWLPPVRRWVDKPELFRFKDLLEGDRFDFVGPHPMYNSFLKTCFKTGDRSYRDTDGTDHEVGSTGCRVYHVAREEFVTQS